MFHRAASYRHGIKSAIPSLPHRLKHSFVLPPLGTSVIGRRTLTFGGGIADRHYSNSYAASSGCCARPI